MGEAALQIADAPLTTETLWGWWRHVGGRYLLDSIKSANHGVSEDGKTILDFNFAYDPSCFYSPHWICPLSPRTSRLTAPVRGGEGHRP